MAVVHAVGTFTVTAASAAQITEAVTWSDAGTHTPQVALFFSVEGGTGAARGFVGMSDGTNEFAHAIWCSDNVTTADAAARTTQSGCLLETDSTGAESGLFTVTSFGSNQIVLDAVAANAFGATNTVGYVAFAGYDNAVVLLKTVKASAGADPVTGEGFQPTAVLCSIGGVTLDAAQTTSGQLQLGWAAAGAGGSLTPAAANFRARTTRAPTCLASVGSHRALNSTRSR